MRKEGRKSTSFLAQFQNMVKFPKQLEKGLLSKTKECFNFQDLPLGDFGLHDAFVERFQLKRMSLVK